MNGRPGDDPATNIVHNGLSVYSPEADQLVRELAKLPEFRRLQELLGQFVGLSAVEVRLKLDSSLRRFKSEARAWSC